MIYARSLIFNFAFVIWTLVVSIILSPLLLTNPKTIGIVGRVWARGSIALLSFICNLKPEIRGIENLPQMPYIIASKHQSDLETILFHTVLPKPVYVLKKELLAIPIFGYYLKKMGMIAIDRNGQMNALKTMLKEAERTVSTGRPVIIFPEGTRTNPGMQVKYHPGITALYNQGKYNIVPVALNTGVFWQKNSFVKKPGTYIIEFLPAIKPGLSKDEFIKNLYEQIEPKSIALLDGE